MTNSSVNDAVASTRNYKSDYPCRDQLPFLSLEEKVSLISGVSFTNTAGVPRLGVPALKVTTPVHRNKTA